MKNVAQSPWESRDLTAQLARSKDIITSQGKDVFTELFDTLIDDENTTARASHLPLKNAIVSVKDLFDVKGYKTRAGSVFLNKRSAATEDAVAVKLLRDAGAHFIGHTNMTELAYSGLGLNPHYGTPKTPLYPNENRISGGSTSGGAVSVALGIADIALGTDTGGSLRIPAAFCGVTGFKPSQNSVSSEGSLPLSASLDSVGPIANTIADCELAWGVLSGTTVNNPVAKRASFVVPSNFGLDHLDDEVRVAFTHVIDRLKQTPGIQVEEKAFPFLDDYKQLPIWQFSAFEAMAYYTQQYNLDLNALDPKVASRLKRALTIDDKQFLETCNQRKTLIERHKQEVGDSIVLLPTVAILPPKIESLMSNEEYDRINLLCLRNTTLANVLDGCSVSLPYQYQGHPIGVMLTAANGEDNHLLSQSKWVENILANT